MKNARLTKWLETGKIGSKSRCGRLIKRCNADNCNITEIVHVEHSQVVATVINAEVTILVNQPMWESILDAYLDAEQVYNIVLSHVWQEMEATGNTAINLPIRGKLIRAAVKPVHNCYCLTDSMVKMVA